MKAPPQISRDQLLQRLAEKEPPFLIDVLPEEEFKAAHLPGAKNACVYEITFLDDVRKFAPNHATPLVVYGSNAGNLASTTAAEKLIGAGYTRVADYRGGLEEWRSGGGRLEERPEETRRDLIPRNGAHQIDLEKSKIEWTGRNLTGAHTGTIALSGGSIEINGGHPVRGSFTLDMRTIQNTDLKDAAMRQILERHLKSDDFFDVQRFPKGEFWMTRITSLPEAKCGSPNCEIAGELVLKDVRRAIVFRAILASTPEGVLAADAHLDIDRTQWNVLYGSGKFYEKLGKHLVNDEISIGLKLITLRPGA